MTGGILTSNSQATRFLVVGDDDGGVGLNGYLFLEAALILRQLLFLFVVITVPVFLIP